MREERIVHWSRAQYESLTGDLGARGRRRWAAVAARSWGHGGMTAVAKASGFSDRTLRTGSAELQGGCAGAGRAAAAGEWRTASGAGESPRARAGLSKPRRARPARGPASAAAMDLQKDPGAGHGIDPRWAHRESDDGRPPAQSGGVELAR